MPTTSNLVHDVYGVFENDIIFEEVFRIHSQSFNQISKFPQTYQKELFAKYLKIKYQATLQWLSYR